MSSLILPNSVAEDIVNQVTQRASTSTPLLNAGQGVPVFNSPLATATRGMGARAATPAAQLAASALGTSSGTSSAGATGAAGAATRGAAAARTISPTALAGLSTGTAMSRVPAFLRTTKGKIGAGLAAQFAADFAGPRINEAITAGAVDQPGFDRADVGGIAEGAIKGAAFGGTLASFVPVPGVSTLAGILGGGLIGGIGGAFNFFDGDQAPSNEEYEDRLASAISTSGMNPQQAEQVATAYRTMVSLDDSEENRTAAYQFASQMVMEQVFAEEQQQTQTADLLALQAQAAELLAPYQQANTEMAAAQAATYQNLRQHLPPAMQPLVDLQIANANRQALQTNTTALNTVLMQPGLQAVQQQQGQINSAAAQLVQQAMAGAAAGGGQGAIDPLAILQSAV